MKNKNRTKVGLMVVGFSLLIIIISTSCAGCELNALAWESDNGATVTTTLPAVTTTVPVTTTVVTTTAPQVPEFLNPLTGAQTTKELSGKRPLAISVGNTAASMPQYGVGMADILVEAPVEGGITRLLLLSCEYADNDIVGSVRSTRKYLADIAGDFDAIHAYAGTSDTGASTSISGVDTLDYIIQNLTNTYYTDPQRNAPHHIMTTASRLTSSAVLQGYRTTYTPTEYPFEFVNYFGRATLSDNDSLYVRIPYSSAHTTEFKYDSASKTYTRYQFGSIHTDAKTGKALTYTNLFILFCDTVTYDKASGTEISIDVHSGGTGYYISDGKYVDIIWYRDENSNLKFCDKNGATIEINRGKTYIGLVKISTKNSVVLNSK